MPLSPEEQYLLELTNRARLDPLGEAARQGIDLNQGLTPGTLDGTSKQVLAPNGLLEQAAIGHSQWMLATDSFSHTGQNGTDAGERIENAGYTFTGDWAWGENLAWWGTTPGQPNLQQAILEHHNGLFQSFSHRTNTLNGNFQEIGIAQELGVFTNQSVNFNSSMTTLKFATTGNQVFLTGVLFTDINNDQFYNIGEQRSNVEINVQGRGSILTGNGGGYAVSLSPNTTYNVTINHGPYVTTATVGGSDENIKLDLINDDHLVTTGSVTLTSGPITRMTVLGDNAVEIGGNELSNTLTGGRGSDTLRGNGGNDTITGGVGRDVLFAGSGNDELFGGDDNDTLHANSGSNLVYGGNGTDDIFGGTGNDSLYGGANSDLIQGVNGDDLIYGDSGNDTLEGGLGADVIYGGLGTDTLRGDEGRDRLMGDASSDFISGGDENDQLFGGDGNDTLYGDAGNDLARGGTGVDLVYGGNGNDTVEGNSGNDTVYGGDGNDTAYGHVGRDFLYGGIGTDSMYGGEWADELYGGDNNDALYGGQSSDRLYGGLDNDALYGGDSYDRLHGEAGNDTLYGETGGDQIFGGSGNDMVFGGADNDRLDGSSGSDILYGGTGADRFIFRNGQASDSIMDFNRSQGDKIQMDMALFTPGTTLAQVVSNHSTVDGNTTIITMPDGETIIVESFTGLQASDLMWL